MNPFWNMPAERVVITFFSYIYTNYNLVIMWKWNYKSMWQIFYFIFLVWRKCLNLFKVNHYFDSENNSNAIEQQTNKSHYLSFASPGSTYIKSNQVCIHPEKPIYIFNKGHIQMTNFVNSAGWFWQKLRDTVTAKSFQHAVPKNAAMFTIEKHHCMPILPCIPILSYPFFPVPWGLSDAFYPMPGPFSKQTIHKQKRQSGKCG